MHLDNDPVIRRPLHLIWEKPNPTPTVIQLAVEPTSQPQNSQDVKPRRSGLVERLRRSVSLTVLAASFLLSTPQEIVPEIQSNVSSGSNPPLPEASSTPETKKL